MSTNPKRMKPKRGKGRLAADAIIAEKRGVNPQTVRRWRKAGAPVDDPEKLDEWATQDDDPVTTDERNRLYRVQRQRHEHKLARERGTVLDASLVERMMGESMAQLFAGLDRFFCSELPALGKGLDERGIRSLSRKQIESLKADLREKWDARAMAEKQNERS